MTQGSGIRYDHSEALWFISLWRDDSYCPALVDQTCHQRLGHSIPSCDRFLPFRFLFVPLVFPLIINQVFLFNSHDVDSFIITFCNMKQHKVHRHARAFLLPFCCQFCNFYLFLNFLQCNPWGCGSQEAVLQGLLHWHSKKIGQDCRLHLWPLLSDQWKTWKKNWRGLERHDWRGK